MKPNEILFGINMSQAITDKKGQGKGFAKALKRDIGREKDIIKESWEVKPGRSILMNLTRQKLFRYLCEYPCSSLSTIARDIQLSPPSTTWHLKLLIERDLISQKRLGGQKVFFPQEMVDKDSIIILSLLANGKIKEIYNGIKETPGIKQSELTQDLGFSHQSINSFTKKLEGEGVITKVKDGKFTRYYPTNIMNRLELIQRNKLKEFRAWLIKALKFDGVNPKLIRVTDRELIVQITSGKEFKSMKLSVNPFITILNDKVRFLSEL